MDLLISILPYFCTILIAVELFSLSGLNKYLEKLLEPVFTALGDDYAYDEYGQNVFTHLSPPRAGYSGVPQDIALDFF